MSVAAVMVLLALLLPLNAQVMPPLALRMDPLHAMFLSAQTAEGASLEAIRQPYDIVFDRDHHLIISSFDLNQLVRIRIVGAKGFHTVFSKSPLLDGPVGMAFDRDHKFLYVSSFGNDRVLRLDAQTGQDKGWFGNEHELDCPQGLRFGPDGLLYVVSFLHRSVVRYHAASGKFAGVFAASASEGTSAGGGLEGGSSLQRFFYQKRLKVNAAEQKPTLSPGKGWLVGPEMLAFLPCGDLLVSSYFTDNVLRFNASNGAYLGVFASGIEGPVGLAVDQGRVYVSSYLTDTVFVFSSEPTYSTRTVVTRGKLKGPAGLSVAPDGCLYVASHNNHVVARFNGTFHKEKIRFVHAPFSRDR